LESRYKNQKTETPAKLEPGLVGYGPVLEVVREHRVAGSYMVILGGGWVAMSALRGLPTGRLSPELHRA
jgi:hypothetical protein